MPVIVNSRHKHPFLPTLGSLQAIDSARALHQDIRPLEIAIVNFMADKRTTERQLSWGLGNTPLQVNLTFVATDSYFERLDDPVYIPTNTPKAHIRKFYVPWSAINNRKFDGLIVTGVNAKQDRVEDEAFWHEVAAILSWSRTHVFSSFYLCWGAKAGLKYFHDIDSVKGQKKIFGVFPHRRRAESTGLLADFPDVFPLPVSRWKSPDLKAIARTAALEIAAFSREAGPNIITEPAPVGDGTYYPRRVYLLGHPEYDTRTLAKEYERDSRSDPAFPLPRHYFPDDNPRRRVVNTWRGTGRIYGNWVQSIYQATPYNLTM